MKTKLYLTLFCILGVVFLYRSWFSFGPLTSGDWGLVFPDALAKLPVLPASWSPHLGEGLGGNGVFLLGLDSYYLASVALWHRVFHFSWPIIERLTWIIPFLVMASAGPLLLYRSLFPGMPFSVLSALVFVFNSYILMISGGGQMGVMLGYAAAPWVWYGFSRIDRATSRHVMFWSVLTGVFLSVQFMFDVRLTYITLLPVLPVLIAKLREARTRTRLVAFAVPCIITAFLHAFWLLPFSLLRQNPLSGLGEEFVSAGMVKFLSFAPFEHALSLLHPNWPENVFGKLSFLRPEFLLIPLFAFASLLGTPKNTGTHTYVAGLSSVALLGAFFGKGTNEPLGGLYLWLFDHIPGFVMLRDSTKFYLLTALSYSLLIPVTLATVCKKRAATALMVAFVLLWLFIHREGTFGALGGTFRPSMVPEEYMRLARFLTKDREFSRVLWVPARVRYGYSSDLRPGVSLKALGFASPSAFLSWMKTPESNERLARLGISTVVVPTDPYGELFVTDRMYDDAKRERIVAEMSKAAAKGSLEGFGNISVYETARHYGHVFFEDDPLQTIELRMVNGARYEGKLPATDSARTLVFSESFDPGWNMEIDARGIAPVRTHDGLQRYALPPLARDTEFTLRFRAERWVGWGRVIRAVSLGFVVSYLFYATISLWKSRRV